MLLFYLCLACRVGEGDLRFWFRNETEDELAGVGDKLDAEGDDPKDVLYLILKKKKKKNWEWSGRDEL